MKRIAVMTSGGDAPGMNAAIRAVVRTAMSFNMECYGIRQAYRGLLAGDFEKMEHREVSGILQRGGTILQTAREPAFLETLGQKRGLRRLNEQDIDALVVIGGDGSLRGASALCKMGFPVIGIPGTIDNDIYGTDVSIGVDTALNTILESIDRIRDTASSHERAFLIEAMGRNCGYLAMMSGILGGAELVHIPELPLTVEEIGKALEDAYLRGKNHAIAVVAEGANPRIHEIQQYVEQSKDIGFEVRMVILGHTQRGGNPTAADRLLATRMGVRAVKMLMEGISGVMVGLNGNEMEPIPLEEVTSKSKFLDLERWSEIAHILSR
ncbi:MAG TPA: 6-phosphofructokinase [Aggregatilineales bacterium]|nr:6-phosphofructokinase [Aggregatilineales bacterium]